MILCITEKPSVARDIASILGANSRHDGFFDGNGYVVTWTYGHLCTLKEPADYTPLWQRWSLGQLPMLPQKFGIKIIDEEHISTQFKIIEELIAKADEIINCGDAGQEGELIQRWVMQRANAKCPVKRLWISSLTDDAIREGFKNLRPQADFESLYHAGLSRAIGDWILGINATRLYTLKYSPSQGKGSVLSIGRVQTPTLAIIVQRHKEIAAFKAEDYWELRTRYRDVVFNGRGVRLKSQEEAKTLVDALNGLPLTITAVEQKQGREAPPRLFDLTSLQVEANKKWGWSADRTLQLIQSLYEKKVTTYPRVDTTYLSEDLYAKIPTTLSQMTPYAKLTAPLLATQLPKSKKIFDNAKVTDHHAIIPTGVSPSGLVGDEKYLYHLVATRFIAAFYPDCRFDTTTVTAHVGETEFRATGKVITEPGWRDVLTPTRETDDAKSSASSDENQILPEFVQGESGPHQPSFKKITTQAPKPYTEGSLLRAMESAGKSVEDEELREAMKENGIGRPSTRAAIIETLFKRRYVYRQRKSILPTEAGIQLIDTINQELLKSPKLTGIWENKLRKIERQEYSAAQFINELKNQISEIVINVLSDNSSSQIDTRQNDAEKDGGKKSGGKRAPAVRKFEQVVCPLCGQGHILKGRTAYGCSRYKEGCALRLPFEEYPSDLTPSKLNKLISKKFQES